MALVFAVDKCKDWFEESYCLDSHGKGPLRSYRIDSIFEACHSPSVADTER